MNSVELFAGAGGLAIGTAAAGFEHRAVLEWNRNACETIRHNKKRRLRWIRSWDVVEGDVADYDFRWHRESVDVVTGGPPCQPFSIGGKHAGMSDRRNMFPQAVRAVREIRPKAFLFENVKGLTRAGFANYFSYIIHQLQCPTVVRLPDEPWESHLSRLESRHTSSGRKDLRYNVVWRVLNAADYGVPQRRERVFIVGIRSDLDMEFAFPASTHAEDSLLFDKWVSGEYWKDHRVPKSQRPELSPRVERRVERLGLLPRSMLPKRWQTVRDAISDLPRLRPGETCSTFANHFLNPGARSYAGHDGSPHDVPAKALKAGDHGVPGGENTLRFSDGSVRYFSVRECARLQTFPDSWEFKGSWTECMRQLGNAVPVQLASVVASELSNTLRAGDLKVGISKEIARVRHGGKFVTPAR